MYAHELYEQNRPRIVVTYPGRFQPFHQGHAGVFAKLQKEFGADNVYILTSNDTSSTKSPFNFTDKYQLMTAAGVPGDKIVETNLMYVLPEAFDPASTIFVTAVGSPDAARLNPDSFLKRDKKDKDGNVIKPAGSPSYYKSWGMDPNPVTADQHGYVVVIPEIKKEITIKGKKYDVSHGTEARNLWNAVRNDNEAREEFLTQMYKRPSQELAHIFDKIPQPVAEDISNFDGGTTSPIHGFIETVALDRPSKTERLAQKRGPLKTFPELADMLKISGPSLLALITHYPGFPKPVPGIRATYGSHKYYRPEEFKRWVIDNGILARVRKEPKVAEDAAGVGVVATNKKMAKDPRYSMSITKDVKPSTPKNMLRALRLAEDFAARINPEDFKIKNFDKLDHILVNLCEMVVEGQKLNSDAFGMVAACVLDPENKFAFGINYYDDSSDKRIHAERAAIDRYQAEHGDIPAGSIIITTLSPCCHPMEDRYGESCEDIINNTDVHKVYCGYKDPTQTNTGRKTFHTMQTRNPAIVKMCKKFAKTFLGDVVKEDAQSSISEQSIMDLVKKFLPLAMKELKVSKLPKIILKKHVTTHDGQATFGRFVNDEEKIYVGVADRHPVDILRTLAHELVHFKQYVQGKMYPDAGKTGSPIENQAHAVAGVIMRHFNKKYPDAIHVQNLELKETAEQTIEEKYAFILNEDIDELEKSLEGTDQ